MLNALISGNLDFLYANGQILFLGAARAFGMSLMFTAMAWAHMNSGLMRMVFALALGLPVLAPVMANPQASLAALEAPYLVIISKEILLGALIGFVMSLPFEGAVVAGSITDSYRGGGAGLPGPTGEITPYGQLFVIIALWLFAAMGGFWWMADTIYASYSAWPLTRLMPLMSADGLNALTSLFTGMIKLALVVAGPLLILMALTDIGFLIASKIAKQINVSLLAFTVKNLLALFVLPFYALVVIRVYGTEMGQLANIGKVLRSILGG